MTTTLLFVIVVMLAGGYVDLRKRMDALVPLPVEFHEPQVAEQPTGVPQDYTLLLLDADGETRHEIHRHTVEPVSATYSYGERHYTLSHSQDNQHSYKETSDA